MNLRNNHNLNKNTDSKQYDGYFVMPCIAMVWFLFNRDYFEYFNFLKIKYKS